MVLVLLASKSMIYPALYFNYQNSGYAVIKMFDTEMPEEESMLFGMTLENDEETVTFFMHLLSTYIAQAEIFYEKGWYDGFDDGLLSEFNDDDEKIGEQNKLLP